MVIVVLSILLISLNEEKKNYWHVHNNKIVDETGKVCRIKSMGFSNYFWERSKNMPEGHNNEDSYKELRELGFNSVRFCMTYNWFEDDKKPYVYNKKAWEWIDKNIEWAKKNDIKIILNMHIAQGGKLTYDEGLEIWNNENYQKRFKALWKKIARRYVKEDTIIGYDLLNEPYVTYEYSKEKSFKKWNTLAKETINSIRKVDKKHIVFLDRTYGAIDMHTGKCYYPDKETDTIPLVKDNNVVYQVHFYEPAEFTHQSLMKNGKTKKVVYPDSKVTLPSEDNKWNYTVYDADKYNIDNNYSWQYIQTAKIYNDKDCNNACFVVEVSNTKEVSKVCIDDIVVEEYDSEGNYTKDVYRENFDYKLKFAKSNNDKSLEITVKNGQLLVKGKTKNNNMINEEKNMSKFFRVKKGYYYQAYMRVYAEKVMEDTIIKPTIYFYKAKNVGTLNKKYMENYIKNYKKYARDNNVPLFIGEFGVCDMTIKKKLGGEKWVADMIDIMNEYEMNYSYHAYHEETFGLHMDFFPIEKSQPSKALYDVFKDKICSNFTKKK